MSAYDPNGKWCEDSLAGGSGARTASRVIELSRRVDGISRLDKVGVVTLASIALGGRGLGTRSTLGRHAISLVRPHTTLKRLADILTDPLGVMDRMNRLGRDILIQDLL